MGTVCSFVTFLTSLDHFVPDKYIWNILDNPSLKWCVCGLFYVFQELTADLRRFSDQVKTLEGEKESLSQQLTESLATLDQLSQAPPDLNKTQDVLGTLLAEKFKLENKVMQKVSFL